MRRLTSSLIKRIVYRYAIYSGVASLIKSFAHKGLQRFFEMGSTSGIQATHANKLRLQLAAIHASSSVFDLRTPPNWRLHQLSGNLSDHWSLTVNGNWRIIFKYEDGNAYVVNYLDYH